MFTKESVANTTFNLAFLPLDILKIILSYLGHPLYLPTLRLVSKALKNVLTDSALKSFWQEYLLSEFPNHQNASGTTTYAEQYRAEYDLHKKIVSPHALSLLNLIRYNDLDNIKKYRSVQPNYIDAISIFGKDVSCKNETKYMNPIELARRLNRRKLLSYIYETIIKKHYASPVNPPLTSSLSSNRGVWEGKVDGNNNISLYWAAQCGNVEAFNQLSSASETMIMPEDLAACLNVAIRCNDREIVNLILLTDYPVKTNWLKKNILLANTADRHGIKPITAAVKCNNPAMTELLLHAGANVNHAQLSDDRDEHNPLLIACREGYVAVLHTLLQHRADANITSKAGQSLAQIATEHGYNEILEKLLEIGLGPNLKEKLSELLVIASGNGYLKIVTRLIQSDLDINYSNKLGNALTAAVKGNHVAAAQLLLQTSIAVDKPDSDGNQPIHHAARQNLSIVKLLLVKGAVVESFNALHQTPLYIATAHGQLEIVQHLLTLNAKTDHVDADKNTLLHAAVTAKGSSAVKCQLINIFISKGVRVDQTGQLGNTPLLSVCGPDYDYEVVKLLLSHGANVSIKNNFNCSTFFLALVEENVNLAKLLLSAGANVNEHDDTSRPRPAIFYVVRWCSLEIIELLLEHGVNLDVKNKHGNTPLEVARKCERLDVVRLLELWQIKQQVAKQPTLAKVKAILSYEDKGSYSSYFFSTPASKLCAELDKDVGQVDELDRDRSIKKFIMLNEHRINKISFAFLNKFILAQTNNDHSQLLSEPLKELKIL